MSARRSRALDAALHHTPRAARDDTGRGALTRAQVEACARVFDELERLPAFEELERRERALALVAFVGRVERGDVAPDARALALALAARAAAWLGEHPALVPVRTRAWDVALVEAAVLAFNARAVGEPSPLVAEELVCDLIDLEAVVASGSVDAGEAEDLARAFLAFAHRWLVRHPGVFARYQARL